MVLCANKFQKVLALLASKSLRLPGYIQVYTAYLQDSGMEWSLSCSCDISYLFMETIFTKFIHTTDYMISYDYI